VVAGDASPSRLASERPDTLSAAVRTRRLIHARRPGLILSALVATVALAACGNKQAHPTVAPAEGTAASGFYVDAGKITYQVQISRELNPYATEDKNYLDGVSASAPSPSQEWFAVFMWAKNQSKTSATTTKTFTITDTQGNTYTPVVPNETNQFVYRGGTVAAQGRLPESDTIAAADPVQGALLLYKIQIVSLDNRPLKIRIVDPTDASQTASAELDV